jgi:flagellar hook-length control protein FliK
MAPRPSCLEIALPTTSLVSASDLAPPAPPRKAPAAASHASFAELVRTADGPRPQTASEVNCRDARQDSARQDSARQDAARQDASAAGPPPNEAASAAHRVQADAPPRDKSEKHAKSEDADASQGKSADGSALGADQPADAAGTADQAGAQGNAPPAGPQAALILPPAPAPSGPATGPAADGAKALAGVGAAAAADAAAAAAGAISTTADIAASGAEAKAESATGTESAAAGASTSAPADGDKTASQTTVASKDLADPALALAGRSKSARPAKQALPSAAQDASAGQETQEVAKAGSALSSEATAQKPHAEPSDGAKPEGAAAALPQKAESASPAGPPPALQEAQRLATPLPLTSSTGPAAPNAVPLPQLAVTIAAHAKAGESRFEIRLDPPDLGRIDVSLSVDKAGSTAATLTVERMDTLDLLQRDARALERALNTAGFKADQTSLQFNLRDPGQNPQGFAGTGGDTGGQPRRFLLADPDATAASARPAERSLAAYSSSLARLGGLDIRV